MCLELTELTNEKVYLELWGGREDQFRAKKTQSIWKCLCKIFQEIITTKIALKEFTTIYFFLLKGLQNKKLKQNKSLM